jgi:NAD(P)-dependent dehydrogenase (short-subunit alcohol dehydrogenase family)
VVIASRSRERGEAEAAALLASGAQALFVQTDVSKAPDVAALMERAVGAYGSIDILVNNSGIEVPEDLDGPSEDDWDRLFATNTKGTWLCCRFALPHLLQSHGVIVNNASMAGLVGVAGSAGYAASKAAVVSLTRSLALTYADEGLRINAICPGPVATDMTYAGWDAVGGPDEGRRRAFAICPARRIAAPDEVAALVLYLVSNEAASVTGVAIPIDGGKTAGLMPIERYRW